MAYKIHTTTPGEIIALIIFLAGWILALLSANLGVLILFLAIKHGTISPELGMLGMSGCLCFLMISIPWLYMKLLNQD